mmetsp:Transcript_38521/g.43387  ORF Transcript_38521/g.43387 Transcript_38521/m.43387 type:complete len:174 (-) Transcript_38521:220-741(-)
MVTTMRLATNIALFISFTYIYCGMNNDVLIQGFLPQTNNLYATRSGVNNLCLFGKNKKENERKKWGTDTDTDSTIEQPIKRDKNIIEDINGMFQNFDAVVDDFFYKRMGSGEQWYGKRKYDPSGKIDGKYNGMGQTDLLRIEIARVQKEEMELRKERRLLLEEEEEGNKKLRK